MTSSTGHHESQQMGTFLGGWGGVIAVLLGIALAVALSPVIQELILLFRRVMITLGMSADTAVVVIYWMGMIAIGIGVAIVLIGSDERMDQLRGGVGDWQAVLRETLIATGVVSLWVMAGSTWTLFVDEFNTYGPATELSAVGTLVLIIVGSVVIRWMRHRRLRNE